MSTSTAETWVVLPTPAEPKVSLPWLAFTWATKSASVLPGKDALTVITNGAEATPEIGGEIALRVEGDVLRVFRGRKLEDRRRDQRVAVRRGFRDPFGRGRTGGAGLVLHDEGMFQRTLQPLRSEPRHDIGDTTRGIRRNDGDGTLRPAAWALPAVNVAAIKKPRVIPRNIRRSL